MKTFLSVIAIFLATQIHAQVKGKVIDAETGQPLTAASIFVNYSSGGTYSDRSGEFFLNYQISNRSDLIISCVGYETIIKKISPENIAGPLLIKLRKRSAQLESVRVRNYEKDGWKKWGKVFTETLIGMDKNAADCKLKNPDAVKFIYDKTEEILSAYASVPLVIQNKYLGYTLTYDLESYQLDYKKQIVLFNGYPLFKDLPGTEKQKKLFDEHRKYAYEGSVMHFMRAFYHNALDTNGFEVRALYRYPNREKLRIKELYSTKYASDSMRFSIPSDSSAYYDLMMNIKDSFDVTSPTKITADQISRITDSSTITASFKGYMQVTFAKEKETPVQSLFRIKYVKMKPASIVNLLQESIDIFPDGSYDSPESFFTEGFWGRTEKLFNLLPVDYDLPLKE